MPKKLVPTCEAQGRPTPGQRQHNDLPCICMREPGHSGDHECHCGAHWDSKPTRDLADLIKRIAVTEVRPGDALVFEMAADLCADELDEMARCVRQALGDNTLSLIVNGKLSGVLRTEDVDLQAATEVAREAARAWGGHTDSEALPYMVAAVVRAVVEGGRNQ
jgi:hypothetical protein